MRQIMMIGAAAALAAGSAGAQPFTSQGSAGGWNIFINEATMGCFMEQQQGDLVVQMGTQGGLDFGFLAVYTDQDLGIQQGEMRDVIFLLDDQGFEGSASGVRRERSDGSIINGGFVIAKDPAFGIALSDKQTLTINPQAPSPVKVALTGTKVAIEATRTCQAALEADEHDTVAPSQFVSKGTAGGWAIFLNEATQGCFMEQQQGETIVQIGTQGGADFGFLALYTEQDVGIQQGDALPVILSLDGDLFDGTANGVRRETSDGGVIEGGYLVANNPAFGGALAGKQTLIVNPDGPTPVTVDLTGTMAAMEATRACQADVNAMAN